MREFTPLHTTIWTDQHFITLSNHAQLLYLTCISHPTVSYAGVVDWRPKRLSMLSDTWTVDLVEEAARELEEQRYLVIDWETEEAFVRSMFRNDNYLKQVNLGTTCANDCRKVASPRIHAAIRVELRRLYADRPNLRAWRSRALVDYMREGEVEDEPSEPDSVVHITPNLNENLKVDPEFPKFEGQILKVEGQFPESDPQISKTDPQNPKSDPQNSDSDPQTGDADPQIPGAEGENPKIDPQISNGHNLQLTTNKFSTTSTFLKSKGRQKVEEKIFFDNQLAVGGSADAPPTHGCWKHRIGYIDDCPGCRRSLARRAQNRQGNQLRAQNRGFKTLEPL